MKAAIIGGVCLTILAAVFLYIQDAERTKIKNKGLNKDVETLENAADAVPPGFDADDAAGVFLDRCERRGLDCGPRPPR